VFWPGKLKERVHSENMGVEGKMILKRWLKLQDETAVNPFIWLRTGAPDRCCENGNEHSRSIKCGEIL
jgi:hypothetical protein